MHLFFTRWWALSWWALPWRAPTSRWFQEPEGPACDETAQRFVYGINVEGDLHPSFNLIVYIIVDHPIKYANGDPFNGIV